MRHGGDPRSACALPVQLGIRVPRVLPMHCAATARLSLGENADSRLASGLLPGVLPIPGQSGLSRPVRSCAALPAHLSLASAGLISPSLSHARASTPTHHVFAQGHRKAQAPDSDAHTRRPHTHARAPTRTCKHPNARLGISSIKAGLDVLHSRCVSCQPLCNCVCGHPPRLASIPAWRTGRPHGGQVSEAALHGYAQGSGPWAVYVLGPLGQLRRWACFAGPCVQACRAHGWVCWWMRVRVLARACGRPVHAQDAD